MKKKLWIVAAVMLLCGIVFAAAVGAESENPGQEMTIDGYKVLIVKDKARILERVDPLSGAVEIPSTLGSYQVTEIGENAFFKSEYPNYFAAVTSIAIPSSINYIGEGAFSGCKFLETITVASGNQNFVVEAGVLFNKDMTTLMAYPSGSDETEYAIPDTVTNIANGAFYWNLELYSVTIPGSVERIGDSAFYECVTLANLTIEEGTKPTAIGASAFARCESLEEVILPENVSSIGQHAFEECMSMWKITILNDSISIAKEAFLNIGYTITLYGNANSTTYQYAISNAPQIPFKVIGASYTLSGSITAATAGTVTVTLLKGEEMVDQVEVTLGDTKQGEYSFTVEEIGEYTLRVSMDKHVAREYTVVIGGED